MEIVESKEYQEKLEMYEKLLINKENLKKDAKLYNDLYKMTFGDLNIEIFRLKINGIKLKKMIELYQKKINSGETVNPKKIEREIMIEMENYYKDLNDMINEKKNLSFSFSSNLDFNNIKKLYYKLVKKLHPDLNPVTNNNETLKTLWKDVMFAYEHNDLEELETLDILVSKVLKDLKINDDIIHIKNIDELIKKVEDQILKIRTEVPYIYKFILEDKGKVNEKKQKLKSTISEYKDYNKKLKAEVLRLKNGEAIWTIN